MITEMQTIFIDESGSPPQDNHFVMAVLLVKDIYSLKTIKSAIEDLQKMTGEQDISHSLLENKHEKQFIKRMHEVNYEIWVPFDECINTEVLKTGKDDNEFHLRPMRISRHYVEKFLQKTIFSYCGLTSVVIDEHTSFYKSMTQPSDKNLGTMGEKNTEFYECLKTRKWNSLTKGLPQDVLVPRIVEGKSSQVKGLMAVHLFANGIYRKREKGKDEFFSLFKDKIKVITECYRF